MEENKTILILKMLARLSGKYRISYQKLTSEFDISLRTLYRYLQDIENAGFLLDRRDGSCNLVQDSSKFVHSLFHFNEDDVQMLLQMLDKLDVQDKEKEKLLKKLDILYDIRKLNQLPSSTSEVIAQLKEAISMKRTVKFYNYRSSNGNVVQDREVEPFRFISEYEGIWCLDHKDKCCKQFKLHRIERVEILTMSYVYEHLHNLPFEDLFHMSGKAVLDTIYLEMSMTAANLLKEEFPESKKDLTQIKGLSNTFSLQVPVADYRGVGRFVLGLPGEIKVLGSDAFMEFIEAKRGARATF